MNSVEKKTEGLNLSLGKIARTLGIAFGGAQIISGIKKMSALAAEFEQTAIAFQTMLGSKKAASDMLSDITQFANKTPFTRMQLAGSARLLLNFGMDAKKIMPSIKMLGDVAGGNADRFDRLSLAYAQVQAAGRLMGQDLLQLINAGFNPLQIISEKTGVSMLNLKKQMEKGLISAKDVENAFLLATSAGGKFFGMLGSQSQTFSGRMSTLTDKIQSLAINMGQSINTFLGPALDKAISKLDMMIDKEGAFIGKAQTQTQLFKNLNTNILPLIEQYEKLNNRWDLTEKDREKMASLRAQIGQAIPQAADIGREGNIMDINTGVARKFISNQARIFEDANEIAQRTAESRLKELELRGAQVRLALKANQTNQASFDAASGLAEMNKIQEERNKLEQALTQLRNDRVTAFIRGSQTSSVSNPFSEISKQAQKDKEAGVEKVASGTRNVTLNISQLIGEIKFEKSVERSEAQMMDIVKRVLLTAVNDVNIVAQ